MQNKKIFGNQMEVDIQIENYHIFNAHAKSNRALLPVCKQIVLEVTASLSYYRKYTGCSCIDSQRQQEYNFKLKLCPGKSRLKHKVGKENPP